MRLPCHHPVVVVAVLSMALSLPLATCAMAPASLEKQQAPAATVAVDASGSGDADVPRFFQSTGFTPSAFLLTEQGRLNMLMASGGGYRYMRVHCMLDLIDIQSGIVPNVHRTNYSQLDSAVDAIVHVCGPPDLFSLVLQTSRYCAPPTPPARAHVRPGSCLSLI